MGRHGGASARGFGIPALIVWPGEEGMPPARGEAGRAAKGGEPRLVPPGTSSLAVPAGEGSNWPLLRLRWGVSALMETVAAVRE